MLAHLARAAALVLAVCGAAQAGPSAPAEGLDVRRGDQWVYETRDSQTETLLSTLDVVVTETRANEIAARMRVTDANTGAIRVGAATFDAFWRRKADDASAGDGLQESWGVRPKLSIGDEWSYDFERTVLGGPIRMRWIGHGEVLAAERLELPSGRSFDTLKIEFVERPAVARYRFEMRVEEWFAPEANRYVKREVESRQNGEVADDTTETLLDYVRRR